MYICFAAGFHARINRFPGMAAKSIRRGRRRFKYKVISFQIIMQSFVFQPLAFFCVENESFWLILISCGVNFSLGNLFVHIGSD